MATITRTLDPEITYFSAAEIRVVLLPVGEIPDDVFQHYASLVMGHRQVELSNVRSFYKESQKSPFKFFPWKTGNMHFRFVPEETASSPAALASLHNHRRILGVIGILSCQHTADIARKYKEFEQRCRAFPDATTVRCLAFDPAPDAPGTAAEDAKSRPDLIIFPPGQGDHLINHMEVVMHDFAACMLGGLEGWMLNASPAMVSLSTLIDTPEFTGIPVPPYAAEDDAGRTKRKYARLQKAMGDYSLLAGSPLDAVDHYNTAVELGRASLDWTVAAAAMEGYAAAKLLHAAVSNDAFVSNASSVFRDESAWRSPRRSSVEHSTTPTGEQGGSSVGIQTPRRSADAESGEGEAAAAAAAAQQRQDSEGMASASDAGTVEGDLLTPENSVQGVNSSTQEVAAETGQENGTNDNFDDDAFDGAQFWHALRKSNGLEGEVRALFEDAKSAIRKRGGLPLLVEADLKWARLLAGLHGAGARTEATELANAVQLAAELLPLPEDRLIALTEAASVLGSVGAVRKRVLLMWQAVELSKYFGFPDTRTLAVAQEALEPAAQYGQYHPLRGNSTNGDWNASRKSLPQETAIPLTWAPVRAGCLEATLGLAIYAKKHANVWDAAAALLRDHSKELSAHRMQSLMDNLVAAASQMAPNEKVRPGKGPPPLLYAVAARALPPERAPVWMEASEAHLAVNSPSSRQGSLFLYDPFAAKRKQKKKEGSKSDAENGTVVEWVCGETAIVDIEVANPASVSVKIDKMVLEAVFKPSSSTAGGSGGSVSNSSSGYIPATKAIWKGKPVSLNIPAHTKPVRIQLEGTPLVSGTMILTGCRLTAFGGVSWSQPWSTKPINLSKQLAHVSAGFLAKQQQHGSIGPSTGSSSGAAQLTIAASPRVGPEVTVLPALPKLSLSLHLQSPADHSAAAAAISSVKLLQGQEVSANLVLSNTGSVPVDTVRVRLGDGTAKVTGLIESGTSGTSKVAMTIDATALSKALPLDPGQSATLPVKFSTPGGRGGTHSEDQIVESIAVEYSALHAVSPSYAAAVAEGEAVRQQQVPGRQAKLDVTINVAPSLHVTHIEFAEVYEKSRSRVAGESGSDDHYSARVLMMAEVVNRGRSALETWLGPKAIGNSDGSAVPATGAVVMGPAQRAMVTYVVQQCTEEDIAAESKGDAGVSGSGERRLQQQRSTRNRGGEGAVGSVHIMRYEEKERQACAAYLAGKIGLHFRVPATGGDSTSNDTVITTAGAAASPPQQPAVFGALPLSHGELYNGLTSNTLSLLRPCAVTMKLSVVPLAVEGGADIGIGEESLSNQDKIKALSLAGQQQSGKYCCPAVPAALGQPMKVLLELESQVDEPLNVFCSLACVPVPAMVFADDSTATTAGMVDNNTGSNSAALSPPSLAALASAVPQTVAVATSTSTSGVLSAWTGMHSRLQVALGPKGRSRHVAGVVVVVPGVYRIGVGHASVVYCEKAEEEENGESGKVKNTLVQLHPCYVNVGES